MKKKLFVIVCGKSNQGKTSSLMELVIKLGGGSTSLENDIKKEFLNPKSKRYNDARFVVEYNEYYIYVATAGDNWFTCRTDINFFERKFGNQILYLVAGGSLKKMTILDKQKYKEIEPDVVVGACRPNGDSYGAIKAIHSYSETHILNYVEQLWIKKDKVEHPDNKVYAEELKTRIDKFL